MTNQTIEEAVEEFNELHTISITLQSGMMIGNTTEKACLDSYERLEKHFRQALQAQRDAGARERKGWKGYAVADAETDYYLYSDFFVNKKDAVKYWKNEMSETKGLVIIEVDVYPAITPLPDKE